MNSLEALYTTTVRVAGARSVQSATPLAGAWRDTSPEQLLAASYAACVHRTLCLLATSRGIDLADVVINAHLSLGRLDDDAQPRYAAHVDVELPGVAPEVAAELMRLVEEICPYSKMARHGILNDVIYAA